MDISLAIENLCPIRLINEGIMKTKQIFNKKKTRRKEKEMNKTM